MALQKVREILFLKVELARKVITVKVRVRIVDDQTNEVEGMKTVDFIIRQGETQKATLAGILDIAQAVWNHS